MSELIQILTNFGPVVAMLAVMVFGGWRILLWLRPKADLWFDSQVSLIHSLQKSSEENADSIKRLSEVHEKLVTKLEQVCRASCPTVVEKKLG